MFSYLSTSSSSQPPSQVVLSGEALTTFKKNMIAMPSSSASSGSSQKRKTRKRAIESKSYNTVASRPIAMKVNKEQIYRATLRGEVNGGFTTSNVASTFYSLAFQLANFSQASEYTSLFDQYKIEQIEVWFEPQVSQSTAISNVGELFTCVDLDDANIPTTVGQVESKQNSLLTGGMDGHYHKWRPHNAVAMYNGAFTAYGNVLSQWIDAASPNVQHYGFKAAASNTSVSIVYNVHYRAQVAFKQAGI
jgi:hypothetical protein